MRLNKNNYYESDDFFYYSIELEKHWKESLPKLNDKELLGLFPEAKEIIPDTILSWQKKHDRLSTEIKSALSMVPQKNQWFYDIVFEKLEIPKLLEIENHIFLLKRQLALSNNSVKNHFNRREDFQEMIAIAKSKPLSELARDKLELKPSGKNFVALCPFHNEKTPSCYFYTETNTFYCFGCNEKGDVIKFVMLLYGIGFVEAVKMLQ